jgi:hypothetical protein
MFDDRQDEFRPVDTWLVAVANLGWIVAGSSVVWWRYRRVAAV